MKVFLRCMLGLATLYVLTSAAYAADASSLKPPPGAKVAIVLFEDLECPDCARAYPAVWEAANAHKIPVVRYDFPLPKHPWAFDAAVYARYFDTKSQKMGDDFRGFIYQSQPLITRQNLRQFVQKFADDNKVPLPFAIDPEGNLRDKVKSDYAQGEKIGLERVPTIFVVGQGNVSTPFVEVVDRDQLSQIIEDMQKKAGPATPSKTIASQKKKKAS
jgi:protein-disulfide isomerase